MGKLQPALGHTIRQMRDAKGLTRETFADAVGVTGTTVYRWETARAWPDSETLERIARFFDVAVSSLLGEPKSENPTLEGLISTIQQQEELIRKLKAEPSTAQINTIIEKIGQDGLNALLNCSSQTVTRVRATLDLPEQTKQQKKKGAI